jgi:alanine dehydrogenase
MTLSINEADVRAAVSMERIVDAVELALLEEYDGMVIMPPRSNLMRDKTFFRLMPAYLVRSGLFGYKAFHGSMEKGVRYLIVLCRESDGEILAMIDGAYLTALRTGATSGVATKYMAPEGPATVGLIGSGLEAETNLAAVASVRPVKSVRVYSRNPDRRTRFSKKSSELLGIEVSPVDSPEAAVDGAQIVLVATNTGYNGPVAYRGEWMQPGQHIVSIGATSPFLREIDPQTFSRATHVVFDTPPEQVFEESGDLIAIEGDLRDRLITANTLPTVVASGLMRRTDSDITLFKSVGTAAQDIAAAKAVYDVAIERGLGRDLGELAQPKVF